ncbi:MAG TPA: toll/interleukin-1 receptor domain-containing protein [Candidatus Binatia bacterium]|nr:toll/interleukin-1 receptor domain-containing protein [Candidatus Binatia bacterium]
MSNVFISHSSLDKRFVKRLAIALLSNGFPVWLDSWRLEYGDSLLDSIYTGIDASSLLLLVVSHRSNGSGWVNRELNAALAKEQQIGRKFVIPLKIDDCDLPLKVADRFYADFSSSFSEALERLSEFLAKHGGRDLLVSPERELLALEFTRAVHLNKTSFSRAIEFIRRRQGGCPLGRDQIVFDTDDNYEKLRHRLHKRIDEIESDPYFTPKREQMLREALKNIQGSEDRLKKGVALLVTNLSDSSVANVEEVAYWFSRILARIIHEE